MGLVTNEELCKAVRGIIFKNVMHKYSFILCTVHLVLDFDERLFSDSCSCNNNRLLDRERGWTGGGGGGGGGKGGERESERERELRSLLHKD